jgi:hypothetical protein
MPVWSFEAGLLDDGAAALLEPAWLGDDAAAMLLLSALDGGLLLDEAEELGLAGAVLG